jgi:predicted  nucleic acid-binding Zn-ribbon protein
MATQTKDAQRVTAEPNLGEEMSALSLEQALIDFEIANARVVDLTQRLVAAGEEIAELRRELEVLRAQRREMEKQLDTLGRSRALRVAAAARGVMRAVRR